MNTDKQNIAISVVCQRHTQRKEIHSWNEGKTLPVECDVIIDKNGKKQIIWPDGSSVTELGFEYPLDYTNDLNAMHKAEQIFSTLDMRELYVSQLISIVLKINTKGIPATFAGCFALAFASAAQRAEAFLKILGKWDV